MPPYPTRCNEPLIITQRHLLSLLSKTLSPLQSLTEMEQGDQTDLIAQIELVLEIAGWPRTCVFVVDGED